MTYERIKIIKGLAPKTMLVNGRRSPCECTERITCAYCVQASLLFQQKEARAGDKAFQEFKAQVRRKGLRLMARLLGIDRRTLSAWIKKEKVPLEVIQKVVTA